MATRIVESERIVPRREGDPGDGVVVYWMQRSHRAVFNPALEHAVRRANDLDTTAVAVFCLRPDYPEASARHFVFMLEGLSDTATRLERRGIRFEVVVGEPAEVFAAVADRIALLVTDGGHLPIERRWRDDVAKAIGVPMDEVDGDVVVPARLVSDRMETAARTIRPKIHEHLDDFVVELTSTPLRRSSVPGGDDPVSLATSSPDHDLISIAGLERDAIIDLVDDLGIASTPGPVDDFGGGESAARAALRRFCGGALHDYADSRNRYDESDGCSRLSPYLHFGQLSPVQVVLAARSSGAPAEHVDAFVEEAVVRRELAVNFVRHSNDVGSYSGIPEWARDTLDDHRNDERPRVVTAADLEAGETDDPIWNTIMHAIRRDGWVHNQLRMYWGKQILRWTNTPDHAFRTLLEVNNRWFLDGRDANSYANVGWCFGLHDRGFAERDILGKVRPFTDQALRRKGDLDEWLEANRPSDDAR